jgi:serine/threonine protein kinase
MDAEHANGAGREQVLDALIVAYLEAAEAGQPPDRQALLRRHPDLAGDLAEFFADQDRLDRLAAPLRDLTPGRRAGTPAPLPAPPFRGAPAPPPPAVGPSQRGRFAVLGLHARGGLGQVSLAQDRELERRVALKEIRADRLDGPRVRERFLNEAKITGCLEHPGVVPVHALGEDEHGRPFYAMRFVEGRTLADAARAYHQQPTPLAFNDLLRRFVTVCQTVAYAHSKGVIHRDLKPANVLLGDYGETLVVDWGLAKRLGVATPDPAAYGRPPGPAAAEETTDFVPDSPGGGALTQAGAVLGTPAYMAPEQAAGDVEGTRAAADIYSLGAILYVVLTGRPPYEGKDAAAVLAAVRRGPPPRPGQVRRGCPARWRRCASRRWPATSRTATSRRPT